MSDTLNRAGREQFDRAADAEAEVKALNVALNGLALERDALIKETAILREALKTIADDKICDDEPGKCYQESGPYCGQHSYDDHYVLYARAALSGRAPTP